MIFTTGKNNFDNNTFSFFEWSAPILQKPEEVVEKIHELKLIGRTVKDIVSVGLAYNLNHDLFEYETESEDENCCVYVRTSRRNPEVVSLDCFVEIDEPLLIEFEDGDILALDFSEGSCVRLALNTIPKKILAGTNPCNFNAHVLFKSIVGKELFDIQVVETVSQPEFTGSHGLMLSEQPSYISKLMLKFRDSKKVCYDFSLLEFKAFYNYGFVTLYNQGHQIVQLQHEDIDALVEGFV